MITLATERVNGTLKFLPLVVSTLISPRICLRLTTSSPTPRPDRQWLTCGAKTCSKWGLEVFILGGGDCIASSPKCLACWRIVSRSMPPPSSLTVISVWLPWWAARISITPCSDLPRATRCRVFNHDQRHCVAMHEGSLSSLGWCDQLRFHHEFLVQRFFRTVEKGLATI